MNNIPRDIHIIQVFLNPNGLMNIQLNIYEFEVNKQIQARSKVKAKVHFFLYK